MLLPFFEWIETTSVGEALAQSIWSFAIIESIHLVVLCVLGGSLLIVDLRLLGVGLKSQPIDTLGAYAHRWAVGAAILMIATGMLLMISEPIKLYYNTSFWVKIWTLPVALLFTFTVRKRVIRRAGMKATWRTRLVGGASIAVWFVVAAAGRWIGFS
ncbi:MAG: hypothetical protein OEU54_04645 [Gemmatimonadota bacterium]|nr:hypothetical protein [Gemmatimonadota bacterium]